MNSTAVLERVLPLDQKAVGERLELALSEVRRFVAKAAELVSGIRLEHLVEEGGINPYMVAALGINSPEGVAEMFVYRRVERSLGTSFGNVIEAFLIRLLGGVSGKAADERCRGRGQKPWICWWDIVLRDKRVVLSVKSGPADLNKDIVERFIQHAKEAESKGYRPYLVLTYGKKAFTVAESTLRSWGLDPDKYLLVGRDIFRTLLGVDLYDKIIDEIRAASSGIDIFDLIDRKVGEIADEIRRRYGGDVVGLLKALT